MRRRAAIEPVIGRHAINAILAAAGYNFRLLLRWLRLFMRLFLAILTVQPCSAAA
jgi:IS5 family transposase